MTVLIADDEERDRTWLKDLLTKNLSDHQVTECSDGQQAVEQALKIKPQLVFLDIKMPHLSGIKAAEQILLKLPEPARRLGSL